MKYAKPIKFKDGIRHLIGYLHASNGISATAPWRHEWKEEVDAVKSFSIDPKDYKKYDKVVAKLETFGKAYAKVCEKFDLGSDLFIESTEELYKKL